MLTYNEAVAEFGSTIRTTLLTGDGRSLVAVSNLLESTVTYLVYKTECMKPEWCSTLPEAVVIWNECL